MLLMWAHDQSAPAVISDGVADQHLQLCAVQSLLGTNSAERVKQAIIVWLLSCIGAKRHPRCLLFYCLTSHLT